MRIYKIDLRLEEANIIVIIGIILLKVLSTMLPFLGIEDKVNKDDMVFC